MNDFTNLKIFKKIKEGKPIRICVFGSSNTERFDAGMHWSDYVELGFNNMYGGGFGQLINAGVCGDTSSQMLERFELDIAPYHPDLTIITCGGNDSHASRNIPEELFANNLRELYRRLTALGGEVIFQTYYACDLANMESDYSAAIPRYMQLIRDTAVELKCGLNDNYTRWERLRLYNPDVYRLLMRDFMHVNQYGNMVIGLDLMRKFGLKLNDDKRDYCRIGLFAQCAMDLLERNAKEYAEI